MRSADQPIRISLIAPNGRIVFVHSDLDWSKHVQMTLAAVQALKRK